MDIKQIRENFPNPVPINHECGVELYECPHYSVLDAVVLETDLVRKNWVHPFDIVDALCIDEGDTLFDTIVSLAASIIRLNDAGKFEDAWQRAEEFLALLREHELV